MAKTYAYAIAGGLIATFTISPALSALLLPGKIEETETRWSAALRRVYEPVVEFALANRIITLGGWRAARSCWRCSRCARLGLEFLPKLEEGNFWIRATLPTSISLEDRQRLRQSHAPAHRQLSRKCRRGLAARPAR